MSPLTLNLDPKPPYDFNLSAQIFIDGDDRIRRYLNGRFTKILRINKKLILLSLTSEGSVEYPKLKAELRTDQKISSEDKIEAMKLANKLFSLDLDLKPFYGTVKNDEVLKKITQELYGLKSPTTETVFEALVDSIIEQQISLKVANTLEHRVIKKFGDVLTLDENSYYAYPTPDNLVSASVDDLRECGLSQRKAEYVVGLSRQISNGGLDLEKIKGYEDSDRIIKELDEIRGIGVWTAELTMIRSMQKWDAFPADDLGLRRVISKYYRNGESISAEEARKIAEPWKAWKGLAAYYLIVADMLSVAI